MVQMPITTSLEDLFHWCRGGLWEFLFVKKPPPVSSHFASLVTASLALWHRDTQSKPAEGDLSLPASRGGRLSLMTAAVVGRVTLCCQRLAHASRDV